MLQHRGSPAVGPLSAGRGWHGGEQPNSCDFPPAQPSTGSLGMLSQMHGSVSETGQELHGLGMKIQA